MKLMVGSFSGKCDFTQIQIINVQEVLFISLKNQYLSPTFFFAIKCFSPIVPFSFLLGFALLFLSLCDEILKLVIFQSNEYDVIVSIIFENAAMISCQQYTLKGFSNNMR